MFGPTYYGFDESKRELMDSFIYHMNKGDVNEAYNIGKALTRRKIVDGSLHHAAGGEIALYS